MENIKVGAFCKQVKAIEEYGFNFIGEHFRITDVNSGIVKGKGVNIGVVFGIQADMFDTYFEICEDFVFELSDDFDCCENCEDCDCESDEDWDECDDLCDCEDCKNDRKKIDQEYENLKKDIGKLSNKPNFKDTDLKELLQEELLAMFDDIFEDAEMARELIEDDFMSTEDLVETLKIKVFDIQNNINQIIHAVSLLDMEVKINKK